MSLLWIEDLLSSSAAAAAEQMVCTPKDCRTSLKWICKQLKMKSTPIDASTLKTIFSLSLSSIQHVHTYSCQSNGNFWQSAVSFPTSSRSPCRRLYAKCFALADTNPYSMHPSITCTRVSRLAGWRVRRSASEKPTRVKRENRTITCVRDR